MSKLIRACTVLGASLKTGSLPAQFGRTIILYKFEPEAISIRARPRDTHSFLTQSSLLVGACSYSWKLGRFPEPLFGGAGEPVRTCKSSVVSACGTPRHYDKKTSRGAGPPIPLFGLWSCTARIAAIFSTAASKDKLGRVKRRPIPAVTLCSPCPAPLSSLVRVSSWSSDLDCFSSSDGSSDLGHLLGCLGNTDFGPGGNV